MRKRNERAGVAVSSTAHQPSLGQSARQSAQPAPRNTTLARTDTVAPPAPSASASRIAPQIQVQVSFDAAPAPSVQGTANIAKPAAVQHVQEPLAPLANSTNRQADSA